MNHQEEIRDSAIKSVVKIYKRSTDATRKVIEKQARLYLGFIALGLPPPEVLGSRNNYRMPWTDNLYKLCLNLIMTLLQENEGNFTIMGVQGSSWRQRHLVSSSCNFSWDCRC